MTFRSPDKALWRDQTVLVTGHTGFKGGWLTHILKMLGSRVHGLSVEPISRPNFFEVTEVHKAVLTDNRCDIRVLSEVQKTLNIVKPRLVFHLAAQPLVSDGYSHPVDTWETNVLGTLNILEAARQCPSVEAVVLVTTDKVYRNNEWVFPYRENDVLGGLDPYSASKSATELLAASYNHSFFRNNSASNIRLATARAGNVLGGGDWSENRLMPDLFRAIGTSNKISLRNSRAYRPWQHVLDPLNGYILLAEYLLQPGPSKFIDAWNFGPDPQSVVTVEDLVHMFVESYPGITIEYQIESSPNHEGQRLALDSSQAKALLGWTPRWALRETIQETVKWHQAWSNGANMKRVTQDQIEYFINEGSQT